MPVLTSSARSSRLSAFAAVWTLLCGALSGPLMGQSSLEFEELQATLRTAYARIQQLETQGAGAGQGVTAQSAATANEQAEQLKQKYIGLRELIEALGISALDQDGDEVADRLVTALREMRLIEEQKNRLAEGLLTLLEATVEYTQVSAPGNPQAAAKLSSAVQLAEGALKGAAPQSEQGKLTEARIVSVKPDLGVAVLNIGADAGAKPGMPLGVYRGDQPIATVLLTEVRQTVSGAVIQEVFSQTDALRVGDIGRVETNLTN